MIDLKTIFIINTDIFLFFFVACEYSNLWDVSQEIWRLYLETSLGPGGEWDWADVILPLLEILRTAVQGKVSRNIFSRSAVYCT